MLILILIAVQYSQIAVLFFGKGSHGQNHSSGFHHPVIKPPQQKFQFSFLWGDSPHLNAIWKTLGCSVKVVLRHVLSVVSSRAALLKFIFCFLFESAIPRLKADCIAHLCGVTN